MTHKAPWLSPVTHYKAARNVDPVSSLGKTPGNRATTQRGHGACIATTRTAARDDPAK